MSQTGIHSIRLQGPWQVIPPGADPLGPGLDVTLPASWQTLFDDTTGVAIFRRRFNCPTGLETGDRVLIRIPCDAGRVSGCSLNGTALAGLASDPWAFDVTDCLAPFNQLEVRIRREPGDDALQACGLVRPVTLEIHSLPR